MPSESEKKFVKNTWQVERLLEIHEHIAGCGRGRKYQLEILNKSAIVILTACWEAYIEDLCRESLDFLMKNLEIPDLLSASMKVAASRSLRENRDEREVWKLAGSGWKSIVKPFILNSVDSFNTPKTDNVDELVERATGLKKLSQRWKWRGMSTKGSKRKLDSLIKIRCDIAHAVSSAKPVRKGHVQDALDFIKRLVSVSDGECRKQIHNVTNKYPWPIESA
ncbi:MAG: HEPN domain-containing protein [bacterium]